MPDFVIAFALKAAIPVVTVFVGKALLNSREYLDKLPAVAKTAVVTFIASALTALQAQFPDLCGGQACGVETVSASALAAILIHQAIKYLKSAKKA